MSIGQGFTLSTPLQIAVATAAIANGGTVYQPKIVQQITDSEGKGTSQFQPEILDSDFLDFENIRAAQIGMRQAVTDGSAIALSYLPISIAGKTGTSQFDGADLSRTHAWFTSYAPYDNPKIALTILIEAGGEGSGVAVPVAADLYRWYAENR
jgi:penicillin-binding protein 2